MQQINVAIHTWILKFAGAIESKHAIDSTGDNVCTEFRALYEKSNKQTLNDKEWLDLKRSMETIAKMVLNAGVVIVATTIQTQLDLLKDSVFKHVIIDETSVLTHVEMLCAWRGDETLTLIWGFETTSFNYTDEPLRQPVCQCIVVQTISAFRRPGTSRLPTEACRENDGRA